MRYEAGAASGTCRAIRRVVEDSRKEQVARCVEALEASERIFTVGPEVDAVGRLVGFFVRFDAGPTFRGEDMIVALSQAAMWLMCGGGKS